MSVLLVMPAAAGRAALALILVALALGLATSARADAAAIPLTVSSTPVSQPVSSGFVGISTETYDLEQYAGNDPAHVNQAFVNLLGAISPGQSVVLRLGGDSTDWSWYPVAHQPKPPGIRYTLTNKWLQMARATAEQAHAKLLLGVNLEANSKADAVGEADAFVKRIGAGNIDAIEIGNEPELYTHFNWYRTKSGQGVLGRVASAWTPASYRAQFKSFAQAMPKVGIAGPVSGLGTWLDQLPAFLHQDSFVHLVTMHAYPLKHCTPSHVVTIADMLAPAASTGFAASLAPYVNAAHAAGKPIRIDETNAITCGGTQGVSNSFASALWMLDDLFGLARQGVNGLNVHMVPHSINSILNPITVDGREQIQVQPAYYAMMMFAQDAPPGSRITQIQGALPPTVTAWSTRATDGTVHVVLINRSARGGQTVKLTVPDASGPASVEQLRAQSLSALGGVTLGGQRFGNGAGDPTSTGLLTGTSTATTIAPTGRTYRVTLPAASAVSLTMNPPAHSFLQLELGDAILPTSW